MNENNQPQSQQTKREKGFYWVRMNDFWKVCEYTDHHGRWRVPSNDCVLYDNSWDEIDERRITRQPSHSPTEQPGDAALRQGLSEIEPPMGDFILKQTDIPPIMLAHGAYYHYSQVSVLLRRKQAELVVENEKLRDERNGLRYDLFHVTAERDELNNAIAHVWKVLGITDYTGKHISEHVSELRSERDKMREALKISKSWVSQITNVYLEEGRDKIVSIIESALSGGSKQ